MWFLSKEVASHDNEQIRQKNFKLFPVILLISETGHNNYQEQKSCV